jgi:prophage antirepressor-like protein
MNISLTFNDITFSPVPHQNSLWIRAVELARALGYSSEEKVSRVYRRNADEFTPDMTQLIEISAEAQSGLLDNLSAGRCRIFSLRGCHLLAMFARTPVAKAFRRWVLDVLDRLAAEERAALPEVPHIKITPSTTASRKPLRSLVNAWARLSGQHQETLWPQVKAHFQLERIDDLPEEWIPDALEWVQGKIDSLTPALPPTDKESLTVAAAALPFQSDLPADDIDGHFAAIREHIRQINNHEDAIFQAARKGMPSLRGTSSLALLIHRNMENAGWSLHYALKSLEASARIAVTAGQI